MNVEERVVALEALLDPFPGKSLRHAMDYLANDPEGSAGKSRLVLELLLRSAHIEIKEKDLKVRGGRPPSIGDYLHDSTLKSRISRGTLRRMKFIADAGNTGVHGERVSPQGAEETLDLLLRVLEAFHGPGSHGWWKPPVATGGRDPLPSADPGAFRLSDADEPRAPEEPPDEAGCPVTQEVDAPSETLSEAPSKLERRATDAALALETALKDPDFLATALPGYGWVRRNPLSTPVLVSIGVEADVEGVRKILGEEEAAAMASLLELDLPAGGAEAQGLGSVASKLSDTRRAVERMQHSSTAAEVAAALLDLLNAVGQWLPADLLPPMEDETAPLLEAAVAALDEEMGRPSPDDIEAKLVGSSFRFSRPWWPLLRTARVLDAIR